MKLKKFCLWYNYYIIILLVMSLISCKKTLNPTNTKIIIQSIDSTEYLNNDTLYFKDIQKKIREKKYKSFVTEIVKFPIEGDCIFYFCYGDSVFEKGLEYYENKLDSSVFLDNFHNIFDDKTTDLILKANFTLLLRDKNYCFEKEYKDGKANISITYYNNEYKLFISSKDPTESIGDHSVVYAFKRIHGRLKLYKIYAIG